jgi:hypothetical protein
VKQEGAQKPQARGERPDAKPESKQGAKPFRPKAGPGSRPGAKPGAGRPRRRPHTTRGKKYEKPTDAQDARMAIYKNKYGEDSTAPEKKSAKPPEEKVGLFKRVLKSFWKK